MLSELEHYLAIVVVALLQGLTEFLPISSSAHLIILPHWLGWEEQGIIVDVAVHFGTLLAVVFYFRKHLTNIANATVRSVIHRQIDTDTKLVLNLIIATLPIVVFGYFMKDFVDTELRTIPIIAFATIGFGVLLWLADLNKNVVKDESVMTLTQALIIGFAQVLALIPGTSRSGITITCALLLGFSRTSSSRFSFLLAIPTISGAALLTFLDALQIANSVDWIELGIGIGVSFLTAYLCIDLFLRFVEKIGLLPFVLYRVVLGSALLFSLWFV